MSRGDLIGKIVALERENAWFRKQLFGRKSERRLLQAEPSKQIPLGDDFTAEPPPPADETVRAYQRKRTTLPELSEDETPVRFDPSVPVETIAVPDPRLTGLLEGKDYEVLREAVTERLAQRPGSYVVLRYVRKVVKLKDDGVPSSPPAPPAVIDRSVADVSFIAGLLVDKFTYHLPLYRQHQRLQAAGIKLSRQTLTNLVARGVSLLEPVYYAQHSSVLLSEVLAMDETPIKAGQKSPGKLNQGYYWALYGDKDEVSFEYSPTRAFSVVREILGSFCGVLIADGYGAYDRYAQEEKDVVLAQCWAHTRRNFVEAEGAEREAERTKFVARYIERGPISLEKLTIQDDIITYTTKDERTHEFDAMEFLALLSCHIPKPYESITRYYGWYSCRARGERKKRIPVQDSPPPESKGRPSLTWAQCFKRIYEINPLACPP